MVNGSLSLSFDNGTNPTSNLDTYSWARTKSSALAAWTAKRRRPTMAGAGTGRMLALVPVAAEPERPNSKSGARAWAFARSGFAAAAAAALAAAIGAAVLLVNEHRRQNNLFAMQRARDRVAGAVRESAERSSRCDRKRGAGRRSGRIAALDRRNEIRHRVRPAILAARSHNFHNAWKNWIAKETAKVDSLGQRVDRDASKREAELATRIEKLEKRPIAPIVGRPARPCPFRADPDRPPARLGSVQTFRWRRRVRFRGQGRRCRAISSSMGDMTRRWSGDATANGKCGLAIFFPGPDGSSESSGGAAAGSS